MEYIRVMDLRPLHFPGVSKRRIRLERLSDRRLLDSVRHPLNNDFMKIDVKSGRIVDGNGRPANNSGGMQMLTIKEFASSRAYTRGIWPVSKGPID